MFSDLDPVLFDGFHNHFTVLAHQPPIFKKFIPHSSYRRNMRHVPIEWIHGQTKKITGGRSGNITVALQTIEFRVQIKNDRIC